jgi:hypothetical protein
MTLRPNNFFQYQLWTRHSRNYKGPSPDRKFTTVIGNNPRSEQHASKDTEGFYVTTCLTLQLCFVMCCALRQSAIPITNTNDIQLIVKTDESRSV